MGHWCEKLLFMVQKKGVINFKSERRKKIISKLKPKIKKKHAEICNGKIQQNQNSTGFMSR